MKPLFWFNVLKGILAAGVTVGLLLIAFAFCGARSDDPSKYISICSNIALYISMVIGGAVSARRAEQPILCALLCGVVCAVLLLIPSLILAHWGALSLLRLTLTVVVSIFGGMIFSEKEGNSSRNGRRKSEKRRREIAKKYAGM